MLVATSFRGSISEHNDNNMETNDDVIINMDELSDFSTGCLLDSIDFDELFSVLDDNDVNCGDSDHMLPDLDILGDEQGLSSDDVVSASGSGSGSGSGQDTSSICSQSEGVVDNAGEVLDVNKQDLKQARFGKSKKSATPSSKTHRSKSRCIDGKRKVKVDWTPELHKRFVQAVEHLGEKAVPSRILELMATDGLTRHNIASHLQKFRSHRKHLMTREAEAANWNQRKRVVNPPWSVPKATIGYPRQCLSMLNQNVHHQLRIRPLHVWGHPSANLVQSGGNMWSEHVVPHHLRPPPYLQPQAGWAHPYGPSRGTPYFPPPSQGFVAAPVSAVPHHALYKNTIAANAHPSVSPLFSTHSDERIDAAFEDVLAKPGLPLPIGLKSPAIENVVGELQRQGVPQIPPS